MTLVSIASKILAPMSMPTIRATNCQKLRYRKIMLPPPNKRAKGRPDGDHSVNRGDIRPY
jgi:hypothetical protein